MTTFYTSDPHFSHNNICGENSFEPGRSHFATADEMNESIIESWNATVGELDTVKMLGDCGMNTKSDKLFALLSRLNGHIHIFKGNHDGAKWLNYIELHNYHLSDGELKFKIYTLGEYKKVKTPRVKGTVLLHICHYPIICDRKNMVGVHGHLHSNVRIEKNQINVGMDSPEITQKPFGTPITEEELIDSIIRKGGLNEKQ